MKLTGDKWNLTFYEVLTVYNFIFIKGPYIISDGSQIKWILIAVSKSYHQLPLPMTNTILCEGGDMEDESGGSSREIALSKKHTHTRARLWLYNNGLLSIESMIMVVKLARRHG